ncbi:MAG: class I SAM-dependent methyltransferase [bacterium]|nr:class I SAM-dependent methyltransferase [bacterium]
MEGFFNPEEILKELELREDMTAAEFGTGAGIFAILLAKKLKQGRVYGLDIQEEKLSALKNRAALEKVENIITIHCDLEAVKGSTFQNNFLDVILICNVLFQAEDKGAIIKEAKRVVKLGGQVLIIDWNDNAPFGPKEGRISAIEAKKIAEEAGLSLKKEFKAGAYHYGLLFTE